MTRTTVRTTVASCARTQGALAPCAETRARADTGPATPEADVPEDANDASGVHGAHLPCH